MISTAACTPPGDRSGRRLPGARVITETCGVARATAARAVQELTARGTVIAVPGRGTFVKPRESTSNDD
ncbi:GntR family transcriptional regulator [Actinoallomurus liliacearum]|uniref:GntR family transcriptional regulator n=1 Tax=Actinoallomurus liliacearum TaxID=1080073 RepID=UPI0031EEA380